MAIPGRGQSFARKPEIAMTENPEKTAPPTAAPAKSGSPPPTGQREDQPLRQIGATQEEAAEDQDED